MEITRRRHVRIPLQVPAHLYSSGQPRAEARVQDVSLSGLTLHDVEELPETGQRVYLEFTLPSDRDVPVMVIGNVIWRRGEPGHRTAGVEVIKFFPAGRLALRSYVDRRRRQRLNYNVLDA